MSAERTVDTIRVMEAIDRHCADTINDANALMHRLNELPTGLLLFLAQFYDFITDGITEYQRRTYGIIMDAICELLKNQCHITRYDRNSHRVEFSVSGHFILEEFRRTHCAFGWYNGLDLTVSAYRQIFE